MWQRTCAVACDHAGIELKKLLLAELERRQISAIDLGTSHLESCDYPDFAHAVAESIARGEAGWGLLVCGTGVGMAMSANRHAGVRAVVCSEALSARMSRAHNNANVLCLGARVIGHGTALDILEAFVVTEFEAGRHIARVEKITPVFRPV